jgi:selenocysteine lyase/cysteine desulfurase
VRAFDCDYLVCSGYKIFAPHMGFLWGRYESLQRLPTFREEFIPDEPPGKIEAGTFVYENVAGMDAAVGYLGELGRSVAGLAGQLNGNSLQSDIRRAMHDIRRYEQSLSLELMRILRDNHAQVFGIADDTRVAERVPTFSFILPGISPQAVTDAAARAGIGIRDGHMYAPRLMRRLGLDVQTGVNRVSLVHYNTLAEIHRFGSVLADFRPTV